jgi:hypothetical protein
MTKARLSGIFFKQRAGPCNQTGRACELIEIHKYAGMMLATGFVWLLAVIVLMLAAAALVKYLRS